MRKEYDFSKSVRNPYAEKLERQISISLETETLEYFEKLADETGVPWQNLIALYLRDCVNSKRKPPYQRNV